ncbi:MAG: carboxypeptidase-like regulatory domain-containing protein [Ignavibacteria bacterium]
MSNIMINAMMLICTFILSERITAQGVTFLIKGKVVDEEKKALQGVQVIAKDGDEISGKSKTTASGEFTLTLKPGRYYSMSFERNDLFMARQDFRVPDGTSYQEISQDFQLRTFAKGDTIQQFPLFPAGQANAMPSPLFTMIPEMLKKMPHLKIKVLVSEGKGSGKKTKAEKKTKGKKGSSTPVQTLYDLRVEEIRSKLLIVGAPESRFTFEKASLKTPFDVSVIITTLASDF